MRRSSSTLDYALATGSSMLIYGDDVPWVELLNSIQRHDNRASLLDVRDPASAPDERALRQLLACQFLTTPTVVMVTGTHIPAGLLAIMSEIIDGRLNSATGMPSRLPSGTRVVVLSPAHAPAHELAALFAFHMPAASLAQRPRIH